MRSFGRPGKIYYSATFWHIQKRAPEGLPKWPSGTTFWSKSSKWVFFSIFRFARFILLKKPVFLIYGSGGCYKRVGAQKCQNRFWSRFWRFRPNQPSWPGARNPLKLLCPVYLPQFSQCLPGSAHGMHQAAASTASEQHHTFTSRATEFAHPEPRNSHLQSHKIRTARASSITTA